MAKTTKKVQGIHSLIKFQRHQGVESLTIEGKQELADLFALADLVISRAGANAICELSALNKPNLLIPLSARASRGDQILNARSFEQLGYSKVLEEEELTNDVLLSAVRDLYENREAYITAMSSSKHKDSIQQIVQLFENAVNKTL